MSSAVHFPIIELKQRERYISEFQDRIMKERSNTNGPPYLGKAGGCRLIIVSMNTVLEEFYYELLLIKI
jgi:hypothetical protein